MARIEHIKRRLDNWALWRSRMNGGAHGYATRNILAVCMERVVGLGDYESQIPHFDEDAEQTDRAVQALKIGKGHLYVTLDCIYLQDLGVIETARRMHRAVSTVHAQLEQSDRWIDAWLQAEKTVRDKAAAQADAAASRTRRGFTS
ncbi:hypothetical protein [Brachymonas sp.]|uniref:hypothetical protein n=1 Tax=Brachymonas sp. TaxID=1936292 RepID=UPI0035B2A945